MRARSEETNLDIEGSYSIGREFMGKSTVHFTIEVCGTVQGVGFRPFIFRLASQLSLTGNVCNDGHGVIINIEGSQKNIDTFLRCLKENPPSLACLDRISISEKAVQNYTHFNIIKSTGFPDGHALVPPDAALCQACAREIFDPTDRHYLYPFTNCTNCGPRYTIIKGLPYDRNLTTMDSFPMCTACAREYDDPTDRRFHAQPVACSQCGPRVRLVDSQGKSIAGDWRDRVKNFLKQGKIIAIKGLGGFHLACDARNDRVLAELRYRKRRPTKPFAVMVSDLEVIRLHCRLSAEEEAILNSSSAPIVLLARKTECGLSNLLAPSLSSLGVMLPYTPLHRIILSDTLDILVMTSANITGQPLIKDNREALELKGIADYILMHNRQILNRCDDSVLSIVSGREYFIRRSRGYVPLSLKVPVPADGPVVLGVGGEMKNTFCIVKGGRAFISPHLGEMDTMEGQNNFIEVLNTFKSLLNTQPEVVSMDLHPDYNVSRMAAQLEADQHVKVQHQHAHMASCMAENGITGEVIGVILDGTGYGTDAASWGFEIIKGNYLNYQRLFHLAYVPLPAGDRAVRFPWISATAYLTIFLEEKGKYLSEKLFGKYGIEYTLVQKLLDKQFNCPLVGGCGRLFDAVAALTGVCHESTYEGEAAIRLGELVVADNPEFTDEVTGNPYIFSLEGDIINPGPVLRQIVCDLEEGVSVKEISCKFHMSVVAIILQAMLSINKKDFPNTVVLSGGCWQNNFLLHKVKNGLISQGYKVFNHRQVPTGDGGLSLGQAMLGFYRALEHG